MKMTPAERKILSIPRVQERIVEAMGEWQPGDWYRCPECGLKLYLGEASACIFADSSKDKCIRIPPLGPMPGVESARTLVGMIGPGFQYLKYASAWICCVDAYEPKYYHASTPYLALLLALCAQWGIAADWMEGR